MKTLTLSFSMAALLVMCSPTICQQVLTVPSPGFPTIQSAINAAANGDVVSVLAGTYFEHVNFLGKAITVRGATGAASTILDGGNTDTVVRMQSGEGPASILEHVTVQHGLATTLVEVGALFSIPMSVTWLSVPTGGGIYIDPSSAPTIRDCIIRWNLAVGGGAGIGSGLNFNTPPGPNPITVERCSFIGNTAHAIHDNAAGFVLVEGQSAMVVWRQGAIVRDCDFIGNLSIRLVSLQSELYYTVDIRSTLNPMLIEGCTFTGNGVLPSGSGCAIGLVNANGTTAGPSPTTTVRDCSMELLSGSGINTRSIAEVTISGCRISRLPPAPQTTDYGVGIGGGPQPSFSILNTSVSGFRQGVVSSGYVKRMEFCSIHDNALTGGIFRVSPIPGQTMIRRCAVTRNGIGASPSSVDNGGLTIRLLNSPGQPWTIQDCIIRGNGGAGELPFNNLLPATQIARNFLTMTNTNIGGGWTGMGGGNFDLDPLFVDPLGGDFHLLPGSPCIDVGGPLPGLAPGQTQSRDLDGDPAMVHGAQDVGADEVVLGDCRRGAVGMVAGAPLAVLRVNGSAGSYSGWLDVPLGSPVTITLDGTPTATAPTPFLIWGRLDVPPLAETATVAGATYCVFPFPLVVGQPEFFLLADSLVGDPAALLPATPAPWSRTVVVPLPPIRVTIQGALIENIGATPQISATNAIVVNIE